MNSEQRVAEFAEIKKLLNEAEAMAQYQTFKLGRLQALVAEMEERSKQIKAVED